MLEKGTLLAKIQNERGCLMFWQTGLKWTTLLGNYGHKFFLYLSARPMHVCMARLCKFVLPIQMIHALKSSPIRYNSHTTTSLYIVVNSIGGYGFCPNSLPLLQKKNCIYISTSLASLVEFPDFLKMTMIKQTRYL